MNWPLIMFLGLFITIYSLINYYIAWRGGQALNWLFPSYRWVWHWAVTCLALSYPLGRWIAHYIPHYAGRAIIHVGSYWMAAVYYLFLIFVLCDVVRIFNRMFNFLPQSLRGKFPLLIITAMGAVVLLLVLGTWNARHPVVRDYEVWLDGKGSNLQELKIVAVSDIHLGWIVGIDRLQQMVATVNQLEPDLVLLVGDNIDEGVDLEAEAKMPEILAALQPRLGTFAVLGNHEYISGQAEIAIGFLNQNGVTVLRDQAVEIEGGFYIIGRDDASRRRWSENDRLGLDQLLAGLDSTRLPIILMDHEPSALEEADAARIDLQFSGHTHRGQLFPNNFITAAIYEQDWGYLRKDHLQLIVTSGYGTWGPPIRIGNQPEIVHVSVHFH